MEFPLRTIAATLAPLVGHLAIVFWHDASRDSSFGAAAAGLVNKTGGVTQ
jgi:hypothetical protein